MTKEIYVVDVINGEDLESYTQAFEKLNDAEEVFVREVKGRFENQNNPFTDDDINDMLDDGYYADDTHYSVIIKEVTLK